MFEQIGTRFVSHKKHMMQTIIYLMMILMFPFTFLGQHSPELKITGTKQSWAGGICCRTGTNYTLQLSAPGLDPAQIQIEGIAIDGSCLASGWQSTTGMQGLNLIFGTSQDQYERIFNPEPPHKDHKCPPGNSIRLKLNGESLEIPIGELKELPPVAYP